MVSFNMYRSTWQDGTQGNFPSQFRHIKELVAEQDRQWFAAHQGEARYVRLYVPGELWPGVPPAATDIVVLVTQVVPGMRTRAPLLHVVRRPGCRMTVIDPTSGSILRNVPMEGVDW
jgi:hypothetical protein